MTYSTYENSVDSGAPVELYEFVEGANYYYYTNAPDDFVLLGITYKSQQIDRAEIELTDDVNRGGLSLTFPRDHELASKYLGQLTDFVTTITVRRGHYTDAGQEFITYWKGRVVAAKANGATIELSCESVFTSVRRHGLRARYQRNCRHVIYSYGCGLSQATWEVGGDLLAVVGSVVTMAAAGGQPDGYYIGGILRLPGGGQRLITNHVGVDLTLARPLDGLAAGVEVKIAPGCDHSKSSCTDKFNNLINFGGFPYMPLKNPFGGTSLV